MTYSTRNTRHLRNDSKLSMAYHKRNNAGREWLAAMAIIAVGTIVVTTAAIIGGVAAVAITNQLHDISATIAAATAVLGS